MENDKPDDHLGIPDFLKRDANNRAPFMDQQVDEVKEKPAKAKATAKAKPEKVAKPVKAEAKAPKAKAAKGPEKAKAAKPKAEKDAYGLRKGSSKSEAATMYARKSGATLEEVKAKVGSIQLNVLNDLEAEGWEVVREKQERKGQRAITRYWLKAKK